MVEKSHTVGSWPHLYEPLRGIGQKVAGIGQSTGSEHDRLEPDRSLFSGAQHADKTTHLT